MRFKIRLMQDDVQTRFSSDHDFPKPGMMAIHLDLPCSP
jgi:hypothetical protein